MNSLVAACNHAGGIEAEGHTVTEYEVLSSFSGHPLPETGVVPAKYAEGLGGGMVTLRIAVFVLWAPVVLFLSSGRIDWLIGWIYTGLYTGSILVGMAVIARKAPGLIVERATRHENTKRWDNVLMPIVGFAAPGSIWLVAGLGWRFGWLSAFSPATQMVGVVILVIGIALQFWSMTSNKFFSSVVRIQHDRAQVVISDGPYSYVRHPGYVGFIVVYLATPFVLGSPWALIPAVIASGITVLRTWLEDRTLTDELSGYHEYAHRIRYRLVPGLW